jgi:hypothetical protein
LLYVHVWCKKKYDESRFIPLDPVFDDLDMDFGNTPVHVFIENKKVICL